MSTLVVQERHLWLCLADMRDTDKVRFLNSPCPRPASLATRSRTSPSSSRLYRSSLRRLATSCPGGPLLHPLCRRQHLSLLVAEGDPLRLPPFPHRSNSLHPSGAVEPVVSGVPSPSCTAPSPGGGPGGKSFVFSFCSAGTQIFNKRAVSVISGSEEGSESSGRSKTSPLSSTSSIASGQQRAVRDGHPSLSCTPCPAVEPGKCCTAHSDPATGRLPKRAPRAASLRSTSLPHCGYAGGPLGPTCAVSASLVSAPQSISLAHSDHQARLCDSVRPASPQVQGCPLHFSESWSIPMSCVRRSQSYWRRTR